MSTRQNPKPFLLLMAPSQYSIAPSQNSNLRLVSNFLAFFHRATVSNFLAFLGTAVQVWFVPLLQSN